MDRLLFAYNVYYICLSAPFSRSQLINNKHSFSNPRTQTVFLIAYKYCLLNIFRSWTWTTERKTKGLWQEISFIQASWKQVGSTAATAKESWPPKSALLPVSQIKRQLLAFLCIKIFWNNNNDNNGNSYINFRIFSITQSWEDIWHILREMSLRVTGDLGTWTIHFL